MLFYFNLKQNVVKQPGQAIDITSFCPKTVFQN